MLNHCQSAFQGGRSPRGPHLHKPRDNVAGDEFAAIINPDRLGTAHLAADPFLRLDDILAAISEPSFCCRAEAKMGINDVQNAELVPKSQLIMNKIDRPDVIGAMAF